MLTDRTNEIELASGGFLDFAAPELAAITLRDVAHGLALTCRFGGQCAEFYSVAEHTLLVSRRLAEMGFSHEIQLYGLHHDDSEAFITDVPRPAKLMLPEYKALEDRLQSVILAKLGVHEIGVFGHSVVKQADNWALAQEAGELVRSRGALWDVGYEWDGVERSLGAHSWRVIRETWLRRHRYLMGKVALPTQREEGDPPYASSDAGTVATEQLLRL